MIPLNNKIIFAHSIAEDDDSQEICEHVIAFVASGRIYVIRENHFQMISKPNRTDRIGRIIIGYYAEALQGVHRACFVRD